MKMHTKKINGCQVSAYNDSGCDWVVECNGHKERFPQRKSHGKEGWTMREAMEFMASCFGSESNG